MEAEDRNAIETAARDWAIRLDGAPLSPEERARLDAWISTDRRHHGALVRARAVWLDADRLAALAGGTVPATSEVSNAAPEQTLRPHPEHPAQPECTAPSKRRWPARIYAIAASLATVCLALYLLWYADVFSGETYASEIGEVRNIELADGSELILNTNTRTTVLYKETERGIALSRGEALFKVAHDTTRPFIVRANDVQVTAIGTAFTVRIDDARVDVMVTEGIVEVARRGGAATQRVSANHRAVIASRQSRVDIEAIDPGELTRQLAWREGKLAFAGEPLGIAVAEFNRHSRHPIHVDDPMLAARPVVGIFHASDTEAFANAAAATFGAEVVHEGGAIHLRAAPVAKATDAQ